MWATRMALGHLAINVCKYGMCFAPSKYKLLLHDWLEPVPALTFAGKPLDV
ncbi:unnamed protein product, partial [Trichobilharzia regenti]